MELIHDLAEIDPLLNSDQVMNELAQFISKREFFSKNFVTKSALLTEAIIWWTGICSNFQLAKLAESIISLPPTSAAVERSFSRHAWIHSARRNRLTAETASKLVNISHNINLQEKKEAALEQKKTPTMKSPMTPCRSDTTPPPVDLTRAVPSASGMASKSTEPRTLIFDDVMDTDTDPNKEIPLCFNSSSDCSDEL